MKSTSTFLSIILFAFTLHADPPTVLKFSNRSFELGNPATDDSVSKKLENLDPTSEEFKQLYEKIMAESMNPKIDLRAVITNFYSTHPQSSLTEIEKFFAENRIKLSARYSIELNNYLENLIRKHQGKAEHDKTFMIFSVRDGLEFFEDFYKFEGHSDPYFIAYAQALFQGQDRYMKVADKTERLATGIFSQIIAETHLLDTNVFTIDDIHTLQRIAALHKIPTRFEKINNIWLFGTGFSYLLTRDLMKKGFALTDSALRQKFEKVVRYHVGFGVPITHSYEQGDDAFFSSETGKMTFVLPSDSGLNSYTHEMTHSRFSHFTNTLNKWAQSKGYLVPYHIDGPISTSSIDPRGGLFTLLNELNSWEIGESFDGNNSIAKILKILTNGYGEEAGYEATELLQQVWTPAKLKGQLVPFLIYSEIRNYNKLSLADLLLLGEEGASQNDAVKKMNFLIMYAAKKFAGTKSEADAQKVLEDIAKASSEKSVLAALAKIDAKYQVKAVEKSETDLSNANLDDVLNEFVKTGSEASAKLLFIKFMRHLGPEHVAKIVQRGMLAKTNTDGEHEAIVVLKELFKTRQIQMAVDVDHDGALRGPIQGNPFLVALDKALSAQAFDNGIPSKKMEFINYIAKQTLPEEMPRTYAKFLKNIMHGKGDNNSWLARCLLMTDGQGLSFAWGEKIVETAMKNSDSPESVREAIGFFYNFEISNTLLNDNPGFGLFAASTVDDRARTSYLREIAKLPIEKKRRLETTSRNLWSLVGDKDASVRNSALYAMLSNPMFIISNQTRILNSTVKKDPAYAEAVAFVMDAAPELLPQLRGMSLPTEALKTGPGLSLQCKALF